MNNREIMQALLSGEKTEFTPQWLMGFSSIRLFREFIPENLRYSGYGEYPEEGAYPFSSLGEDSLERERLLNITIDRVAFPVGWGANAAFGHCGPGEFNKRVVEKQDTHVIYEYETGAKKEVRYKPHFVHTFYLPVSDEASLERLVLPNPLDGARYAGFREDVAWAKARGLWTVGWLNGFFSGVHYFLRDYPEFMMDLLAEPEFAGRMVNLVGEWNLASAKMMCEAGVDCIGFCDDFGSEKSMLISPELYRKFFFPWHVKLCELAHGYSAVVHMHSHGAIMPIARDISRAGVDILNPLDPDENMPIRELREAVGPKMVLCGGLNKHFFDWTIPEMEAELKKVILDGREYGPHILMDSGGIPDNIPTEKMKWFFERGRELRGAK